MATTIYICDNSRLMIIPSLQRVSDKQILYTWYIYLLGGKLVLYRAIFDIINIYSK